MLGRVWLGGGPGLYAGVNTVEERGRDIRSVRVDRSITQGPLDSGDTAGLFLLK